MNLQLLSPTEYVKQATKLTHSATRRISLLTMVVADQESTHDLLEAIKAAAQRGVEVHVSADIFTYGELNGNFLGIGYARQAVRRTSEMARTLRQAGVKFTWLGHGRITLFNGRTHNKWCVIDDTVFSFGGVNLYDIGVSHVDYMFRVTDPRLADRIVHEQHRIKRAERTATNYSSIGFEIDGSTVWFDGGIMGHSAIYRRARELALQSTHVLFVSQYCPSGRLAQALRKTNHDIYFNQPERSPLLNRFLIRMNMLLTGFRSAYQRKKYLHAKYLIFTLKDGNKVAMTGSHNFAYAGVLFGTREVALETKDPAVITQLETFTKKKIV